MCKKTFFMFAFFTASIFYPALAQQCYESYLSKGKKEYLAKHYQKAKEDFTTGLNCPGIGETKKKMLNEWVAKCDSNVKGQDKVAQAKKKDQVSKVAFSKETIKNVVIFLVNNKYGLKRGDRIFVNPIYDTLYKVPGSNLLIVTRKENNYGLLDSSGNVILPTEYERTYLEYDLVILRKHRLPYNMYTIINSKGYIFLTNVEISDWRRILTLDSVPTDLFRITYRNRRVQYINSKTHYFSKIYLSGGLYCSEGAIEVVDNDNFLQQQKWGYISTDGSVLITPEYEWAYEFNEGLAPVRKDQKWGYIDKMNRLLINYQFESAGRFSDGQANVQKDGNDGVINKKGEFRRD